MSAARAVRRDTSPVRPPGWGGLFNGRIKRADFQQGRYTILLGGDGKPLLSSGGFISWQAAFVLLSRPGVHVVEYYPDKVVHTTHGPHRLPRKMMIPGQLGAHNRVMSMNLPNLMVRDGGRCMYTGEWVVPSHRDPRHQATIDHVIPRGYGGEDCWSNVVLASAEANNRKACRTPEQAGMQMLYHPWAMKELDFLYLVLHHEAGLYERWDDVIHLADVSPHAKGAFKLFQRIRDD